MAKSRCAICGGNIRENFGKWTITFDFSNPEVRPQQKFECCNVCKLEISEYIRRFSNIQMAENAD